MGILGDVAAIATVGIIGVVGIELFGATKGFTTPLPKLLGPATTPTSTVDPSTGLPAIESPAAQTGQQIGAAAGQAATGAVTGVADSIWLGGHSICDFIQFWRAAGAPNASFLGFNVPFSGGGDPNDWGAFSRWMQLSNQFDPGPTPPACF